MSWTAVQPILQNTGMAWDVKLVFLHSCLTLCAMSTGTDMNDAESGDSSAAWLNDVLGSLAVSIKSSSSTLLLSGVLHASFYSNLHSWRQGDCVSTLAAGFRTMFQHNSGQSWHHSWFKSSTVVNKLFPWPLPRHSQQLFNHLLSQLDHHQGFCENADATKNFNLSY
jgi:hypothetical protein